MSGLKEAFGNALFERMGLRRKFVLTLLRNCCSAAMSIDGLSSVSSGETGAVDGAAGEQCEEEESCSVPSSSSSESCRVSSAGEPGCTWTKGARLSAAAMATLMFGGFWRFEMRFDIEMEDPVMELYKRPCNHHQGHSQLAESHQARFTSSAIVNAAASETLEPP